MLNTRKLKIYIIILIAFILASCAQHTPHKELSTGLAKKVQEVVGKDFDFGNLVIMDATTGKSVFLKRTERMEDGRLQYVTKPISGAITVKKPKDVSSYSVFGAEIMQNNDPELPQCNDIGHSFCNIVTINNETVLICKKTESLIQGILGAAGDTIETVIKIPGTILQPKELTDILVKLPKELTEELTELGGGTINDIGFLIVQNLKDGDLKLLKDDDYEKVDYESMRDCISTLTNVKSTSSVVYEGSCCSASSSNGNEKVTCNRRC